MTQLSSSDLREISERSTDVANQNLLTAPSCVTLPPLVGRSSLRVYLTTQEGLIRKVYDLNDGDKSLCWLGNRAKAEDLAEGLDTLANQYHP